MKYHDYKELTDHLAITVMDALPNCPEIEAELGYSNVSCSAYVNVTFWDIDEDGDRSEGYGGCKVRFSDHRDRYDSDLSIRFDDVLGSDVPGNVDLADWRIEEMVERAVAFIKKEMKDQANG